MSVENQTRSVSVYVIYVTEAWSLRNLAPQASSEEWLGSDCKNYERFGLSYQYVAIVRSRLLHAINYFGHRLLAE
jgi:hypothetical protein